MASRAQGPKDADWQALMRASVVRSAGLIGAALLAAFTAIYTIALLSYSAADRAFNTDAAGAPHNWIGQTGAYLADGALTTFGIAAILLSPLGAVFTRRLWRDVPQPHWARQLSLCLLGVLLTAFAIGYAGRASEVGLPAGWGGVPSLVLNNGAEALAGLVADSWRGFLRFLLITLALLAGLALVVLSLELDRPLLKIPAVRLPTLRRGARESEDGVDADTGLVRERAPDDPVPGRAADEATEPKGPATPRPKVKPDDRPPPEIADRKLSPAKATLTNARQGDFFGPYSLPSVDLLDPPPPSEAPKLDKAALERNARLLESVLEDFRVLGEIKAVRPGPVVTMYELDPAPGTKAARVVSLAEDIARNMSALSARVSTVPGRAILGIELPNKTREAVVLQEMIQSSAFAEQTGNLPIILGKNISGDPVVADLAPMPHLLVAGTTGSGKSVGLNCMILSLLYRLTPDQCRMIMIDPKMLELSTYDDIPHLLSPVVTEPAKAIRALKWAVEQMEDRYRMMASLSVRNLANFNEKVRAAKGKGTPLGRKVQIGYDQATGQPEYEEEQLEYEAMPQIVIIVDELADLMMTAGKEVEFLIQRLAQKARAAGIHLIMATQRPSVDVITGVIKANLPTRISFHVTSKIDSRTILGEQGAEQLLGKGDMLYMAGGKQVTRIHGPFVSDDEVRRVADHWRAQGQPDYIQSVTEEPDDGGFALDGIGPDDSAEDAQYRKACQLVFESQKASTSWLQRQLRVGYNSASRLIERMEEEGLVSPPNHVGRREVLRDAFGNDS